MVIIIIIINIKNNGDRYAHRVYLETESNYSPDAKSTHLTAAGYTFQNDDVLDIKKNKGTFKK
uniref:Uncharacterized protein n=1 Tax=Romanomermis culicivorax TaxID=13658 RepID=A0A915IH63_ROMCU